jgi:hypothetical protein
MMMIPEGVEMLTWGMKKTAGPLSGKIVETGMDARSRQSSDKIVDNTLFYTSLVSYLISIIRCHVL